MLKNSYAVILLLTFLAAVPIHVMGQDFSYSDVVIPYTQRQDIPGVCKDGQLVRLIPSNVDVLLKCKAGQYVPFGNISITTFASPPPLLQTNAMYLMTDATSAGTCSGGGSSYALCVWNGTTFVTSGSSGGGSSGSPIIPKSTGYLITAADFAANITFTSQGTFSYTLPASLPPNGAQIWVDNAGAGTVSVLRNGNTINGGATNISMSGNATVHPASVRIVSDGSTGYWTDNVVSPIAGNNCTSNQAVTAIAANTAFGTCLPISPITGATAGAIVCSPTATTLNNCVATPVAQTDGATVTWNMGSNALANGSLLFTDHSGTRTLNITNLAAGYHLLTLTQDGTGGETLTLGTGCTFLVAGGGTASHVVPLTNAANAVDILSLFYDGSTNCYATLLPNFLP